MNLTISPLIRIVALVGLLGVAALGAATMLLGRSSNPTSPTTQAPVRRVVHTPTVAHAQTTPATRAHAAQHAHPAAAPKTAASPAKAKSKPATKTHAKPAAPVHHGNLVYADLPKPLQWQLSLHKVVVVSVYDPQSDADAISVAEAHAGATDASAGFLLVSVLDNKVAGVLTALLPGGGLLPDPGVLIYRAPGNLALRIDGFSDRASVAQAAANVLAGQNGPVASTTPTP
ncbi:MAG TPA: hypothetical protein VMU58_12860 [Gaiellaceae bacterium]|nr:hypothetical protein [Gaiellaceae bacterium]